MQQVAEAAGVTKGYLSRLERDGISPTLGTLFAISKALGVEAASLLEAEQVDVISLGDATAGANEAQGIRHSILTPTNQRYFTLTHSFLAPGADVGSELYTMHCEIETAYVLKGQVRIEFSNRQIDLHVGDAATFSGREPHTYRNLDAQHPAELIWVLAPALGK